MMKTFSSLLSAILASAAPSQAVAQMIRLQGQEAVFHAPAAAPVPAASPAGLTLPAGAIRPLAPISLLRVRAASKAAVSPRPGARRRALLETARRLQRETLAAICATPSLEGSRSASSRVFESSIEEAPAPVQAPASQGLPSLPKKESAWEKIRSLPPSFHVGITGGWTINAMSQEIQAVALPLFTANLFGLEAALLVTGLGYLTRILGAWTGAHFMKRHNPKWVNVAALVSLALSGLPIPVAVALGASKAVVFGTFLLNSAVNGLVYGINRGVAENLLPRLVLGSNDPDRFEFAMNFSYQWVEISCILTAMFAAVPLLKLLSGGPMMAVSSAGIALSSLLYAGLKFREPWKPSDPGREEKPEEGGVQASLGIGDYLPYAFFRFMHFLVYGVMATVLALGVFSSPEAAGTVIGLYDGGSWLASMLATTQLPVDKFDRKRMALLCAGAAAAFAWSPLLHAPALTFALGGLLGGLVTLNSNKWMGYYSDKLPQAKFRDLSKWMMTASILAMLPIFAAVSVSRLFPAAAAVLSIPHILAGTAVAVTAAAAAMALMLYKKT
jgi:hypothetical protein